MPKENHPHNPSTQERMHLMAEEDQSFIQSDAAKGIRLQLDYLKAEVQMQQAGIEHTIVVFGSARIVEFDKAMGSLKHIEESLKKNPHDDALLRKLKKSESLVRKSIYYDEARNFGALVGKSGKNPQDCHVTLMTGGGPGIMEAANRGAYDVGAKSIGLNIKLPHEQFPNPYISPDLCFEFQYFAMRKLHFMQRAKAFVVFPGGFGTFDELFELLTLIQTGKTPAIPVILIGKSYWERAIDFEFLEEECAIDHKDLNILHHANSATEAWEYILSWYDKGDTPLFPATP